MRRYSGKRTYRVKRRRRFGRKKSAYRRNRMQKQSNSGYKGKYTIVLVPQWPENEDSTSGCISLCSGIGN